MTREKINNARKKFNGQKAESLLDLLVRNANRIPYGLHFKCANSFNNF